MTSTSCQWADAFKQFAPAFTEETGITLEFDDISFDVMYEKLKTGFIGGTSNYDLVRGMTMGAIR